MLTSMPAKTLTALKGSIEKWSMIIKGVIAEEGRSNCPLCLMFWAEGCQGCPVKATTGRIGCEESPYTEWVNHNNDMHEGDDVCHEDCPECINLATAERDFLVSLLPEGETP